MTVLPANASKIGVSERLSPPRVLPLKVWPRAREILSQPCEDVTEFDDNLGQLIMDMFYTMETLRGYGLAAPQVGVPKNLLLISIPMEEHVKSTTSPTAPDDVYPTIPKRFVMINPKLVTTSDDLMVMDEGCLSVPGYFEERKRPRNITVSYQDPRGKEHTTKLTYTEAFVFQHEFDHLNGKLFIDDLSLLKKDRIKRKVIKNMHLTTG